MKLIMKRGDTRTAIKAALLDADGNPVELTGATVRFVVAGLSDGKTMDRQADIVNPADGHVLVVFEPGDTDQAGMYRAEFEATFGDGRKETYPNDGYITIEIMPDLG